MAKKKVAAKKHSASSAHRHEPGQCLDLLRQLSAYIDDELPAEICREIRQHVGTCPKCEIFIVSLRQTVVLCRHRPVPSLKSSDRSALRRAILNRAEA
ncbi:MAG: zf-HC2 domain-containing protein [Nitrospira sp.]|nr:zf-HC2 domain-containing protein [Nitrospira sp.]